jgi:hypothetical protein
MTQPLADFWTRDAQEAARSRIGSELRRFYRLPDDMPHQMLALLIQLSDDRSGAAFKIGQLHSAVHQAFRKACQAMRVQAEEDRADFIFDKVIEAVKEGESDPDRICSRVLLELTDHRAFGHSALAMIGTWAEGYRC